MEKEIVIIYNILSKWQYKNTPQSCYMGDEFCDGIDTKYLRIIYKRIFILFDTIEKQRAEIKELKEKYLTLKENIENTINEY